MMRQLVIGALIGFFVAVVIVAALGSRDTSAPAPDAGVAAVDAGCPKCRLGVVRPLGPIAVPQLRFPGQRPVMIPLPSAGLGVDAGG